ncbi:RICIN domain-containing protein [Kitasatospora viridis]|uniref:RICIN domain-containing protein n=1 Tax=Kitasatospora viridis TaxID=281105 RepID=UPI0014783C13|nr:RICIN domain-containing protein [Kitasatospora viridis]
MQKTFSSGRIVRTAGALLALVLASTLATGQDASAAAWPAVINSASRLCLGINGGGDANGTPAIQWGCNGNPDQSWAWVQTSTPGGYELVNGNGLCLEAPGWTTTAGAQLGQWACNGGANQIWNDDGINPDTVSFRNENSHMCISDQSGSPLAGAPIIQWPCNGLGDQLWTWQVG